QAVGAAGGGGSDGDRAVVDGKVHGADRHGVRGGSRMRDGAGDGGAVGGGSDGHRNRRVDDVDGEIAGSGGRGSIFHLHGEGEGAEDGRRAGNGAAGT